MSADTWLQGLADLGCTFVELVRDGKRPRRPLDHYSGMTGPRGLQAALHWLGKGSPVAFMPRPPVWVLDADSPAQVERVVSDLFEHGITPLMVATPRGGAHFYGTLPDDFPLERLKNHLPDGTVPVDYKFGPSTLVVCPGSFRKGIPYHAMTAWTSPPEMDPRWFKADGFWHKLDDRPFLTNQRPLKDRLVAARRYLEVRAPLSVSGKGGHRTLARVCSHLIAFHRIESHTALSMLAPWNARCTDTTGKPCPWSRAELISALDAAVGSVPEAGVKAFQREQADRAKKDRLRDLVSCINLARGDDRVSVGAIRRLFQLAALPGLTAIALGDALAAAGADRILSGPKRTLAIPNLDFDRLLGLVTQGQAQGQGGALNKQVGSHVRKWTPPPSKESQVSDENSIQTRAIPAFCAGFLQSQGAA